MARFARLEVLNTLLDTGLLPVFYHPDLETAKQVVRACAAGGARVVEFTNRGDQAYRVFSELAAYFAREDPGLILGAGSILDAPTGALYLSGGANFIVGPSLNPDLARLCNRRKVSYSPGCATPSEISDAEELGAEIVKVFPADALGGPQFIKSILGPMPWSRLLPMGGVEATQKSLVAWIQAGAAAVGMSTHLLKKDWIEAGAFDAIQALTAQSIAWVSQARGRSNFLGLEHVGLYPTRLEDARGMADWYAGVFDFKLNEGAGSIFLESSGSGRIEVSKLEAGRPAHVAVRVANFELAMEALRAQGVALDEPSLKPDIKTVYLKFTDPAGHRVHLVWRR
jgi:2-dehydro-3-deoxyphosphogluconate aldolase / (4S)-4-hydroxy-2-oxoglutarate aldolase